MASRYPKSSSSSKCKISHAKPRISCHPPLPPYYLELDVFGQKIRSWSTLNFRYKAQPPMESRPKVDIKTKQSKPKKVSGKSKQPKVEPHTTDATPSTCIPDPPSHSDDRSYTLPQDCLLGIFSYLSASDLLKVGKVCKSWNQLSSDKSLWKSVSLEDSHVGDWVRAAMVFQTQGTIALDFFNNTMSQHERHAYFKGICYLIRELPQLQHLSFGHASTALISKITQHLPNLRVLQVCWLEEIFEESNIVSFDLGKLSKLVKLRELKIRSIKSLMQPQLSFSGGLPSLGNLQHLQKLSLTSLDETRICPLDYNFLNRLPELVALELGDCGNWRTEAYKILGKLNKLHSLRLENGGCWCEKDASTDANKYMSPCTCNIAETLSKLKELEKLELIMYAMPSDINPALKSLLKLTTLTFWPVACLRGHVYGPCAIGCEAPLIQTNTSECKALGDLQSLRHLTWGVPIITYGNPKKQYPFNVTTETAVKSEEVLGLTKMLGTKFPETAVNVLIVPVVMVDPRQQFSGFGCRSDTSSDSWSESEIWDWDDDEMDNSD